jgi:GGDEF domain-containing protein
LAAEEIGHHLGAEVAQLYLVDGRGECLEHVGVWDWDRGARHRPSGTDSAPLRRDEGLPGRVWLEREAGSVPDLQAEMDAGRDPRQHPPEARGAVALPLISGSGVIGVLEFWYARILTTGRDLVDEVEPAVRVLGAALGRVRAEERLAEVTDRSFVLVLRRTEAKRRDAKPLDAFPIAFASPSFSRITGYSSAELSGLSLGALLGAETAPGTALDLARSLERGKRIATEFIAYRKDGASFPLRLEATPVLGGAGAGAPTHYVVMPPEAPEPIGPAVRRGESDPLTGLPNRLVLNNALRRALERARRTREYHFAVLFVDLDGFKAINDRLGHMVGDQLLAAASAWRGRSGCRGTTSASAPASAWR